MGATFKCGNKTSTKYDKYQSSITKFRNIFYPHELCMLMMIYKDLSQRSTNLLLSRDAFNSYFKILGIWGEQIFNKFVHKQEEYMTFDEFLQGLQMYIKCSEDQQIQNLFKLYDLKNQNGIAKAEFLLMLHNYSREELTLILNDQLFLEEEQIINAYHKSKRIPPRKNSEHLMKISLHVKKSNHNNLSDSKEMNENPQSEIFQSCNSRNSIDQIFSLDSRAHLNGVPLKGFGVNLMFQVNGQLVEMQANINLLIKKYADMVYRQKQDNLLNQEEFTTFVKRHPNFIKPLYSVLNYQIWGYKENVTLYRNMIVDFEGELYKNEKNKKIKTIYCRVYPNILMEFNKKDDVKPKKIICLSGLIIEERIDYVNQKFGFEIFHINKAYTHKNYNCSDEYSFNNWQKSLQLYFNGEINQKYSILEKIGEGKYSIVYKCQKKNEKKFYALKVIHKTNLSNDELQTVKHEINIMKLLNHSCIIKLIDSIENRNNIYIVTELIEDGDLFDFVQSKDYYVEEEVAKIFIQLVDAISYVHSIGIVHRDIKPENIMIILSDKKIKQIKLIDFGLANHLSTLQKNETQYHCGTCNYQAPEILQYQQITFAADVFSLGVILYFMLSGFLPFDSEIPQEIIQNTIEGNYSMDDSFWKSVSEEAKDLIKGLLQISPVNRLSLNQVRDHKWIKKHINKQ